MLYSSEILLMRVRLSPKTCRVKPLRRIKTHLLHLVGLISLLIELCLVIISFISHYPSTSDNYTSFPLSSLSFCSQSFPSVICVVCRQWIMLWLPSDDSVQTWATISLSTCELRFIVSVAHTHIDHLLNLNVCVRGLLEKYPTFGREKETGLLGALDT